MKSRFIPSSLSILAIPSPLFLFPSFASSHPPFSRLSFPHPKPYHLAYTFQQQQTNTTNTRTNKQTSSAQSNNPTITFFIPHATQKHLRHLPPSPYTHTHTYPITTMSKPEPHYTKVTILGANNVISLDWVKAIHFANCVMPMTQPKQFSSRQKLLRIVKIQFGIRKCVGVGF